MPYPFGVDTAFSNTLTPVRVSSIDFAIPRIGSLGYSYIGSPQYFNKTLSADSAFLINVANCQLQSRPVGCYIFSYAWNNASAIHEATEVCDWLDANNISLEMPVFFDWERTGAGTYGSYEMVTAAGITVTMPLVQGFTLAFMDEVNNRGRTAGWYGNLDSVYSFYGDQWTTDRMGENYYFWLAQWGSSFSRACDVWQYAGDQQWMGIDADYNYLIDERCVNGQIGHRFPKWLIAKLINDRKRQVKSFVIRR